MNKVSLILRIVAILAAIVSTALFFMTNGKLREKESQVTSLQQSVATKQSELKSANSEISTLTNDLNAKKKAAAKLQNQIDSLRPELYSAKQEASRTQAQLSQTQNQLAQLENERSQLNTQIAATREQLTLLQNATPTLSQDEIDALEQRVAALESQNQNLKDELSVFEAKAAAMNSSKRGTAGASSNATSDYALNLQPAVQPATLASEATITKVSSRDGLLVLAADPDLALNAGLELTLVKDLKAIGRVQILEAEGRYALANILPGTRASKLREGSVVNLLR